MVAKIKARARRIYLMTFRVNHAERATFRGLARKLQESEAALLRRLIREEAARKEVM